MLVVNHLMICYTKLQKVAAKLHEWICLEQRITVNSYNEQYSAFKYTKIFHQTNKNVQCAYIQRCHCIIVHILIFYCVNSNDKRPKRKSSHFKVTEIKRIGTMNEKEYQQSTYKYIHSHKHAEQAQSNERLSVYFISSSICNKREVQKRRRMIWIKGTHWQSDMKILNWWSNKESISRMSALEREKESKNKNSKRIKHIIHEYI